MHRNRQAACRCHLQLTPGAKKAAIQLRLSEKVTAQEAYTIAINKKGVLVQAASPVGIFRAIQTLRKSLPLSSPSSLHPSPFTLHLPYATISDSPRFSYRGVHLDCARHFFSVDVIKRYLDLLALHGCNQPVMAAISRPGLLVSS